MRALTYPTSPKDGIKDEPDGHTSVPIPHWAHKMEWLIPDKQIPSYFWFIQKAYKISWHLVSEGIIY